MFAQSTQGITGWVAFNETKEPIDNVAVRIHRSHAGPEHEADESLALRDLNEAQEIRIGTLLPETASNIGSVPERLMPYSDKPSLYQISIFTRFENLTEFLYVTPKEANGWAIKQAVDLGSNKTKKWLRRDAEKAQKAWKNWPEWWR